MTREAGDMGMVINCGKTQLLTIGTNNGCSTKAIINTPEGPVHSIESLKLVGFTFGSEPGVHSHVSMIMEQFRARVWMLYHLREVGVEGVRLCRLYCCFIRVVIEYCSVVYHSLLNAGQAEALERLNRQAVQICFSFDIPVDVTFGTYGIQTLESRRKRRIDKFVLKNIKSPRFGPVGPHHRLRN